MEIRARYVLIGVFVLVAIFAGFGFVYWLNNTAGIGPRTTYRVAFDGSVAGLTLGSPVLFNGLTVGEVTSLDLVKDNPGRVMVTIAVNSDTPVRKDTHVGLDFRGLTGTATVSLAGGSAPETFPTGEVPTLVADAGSMKDVTTAARDVLGSIDSLISDNKTPLTDAIANIDAFSKALGANSENVDKIMKGLAKLAGASTDDKLVNYDLTAPTGFSDLPLVPNIQLGVITPTAVIALDSRSIMVQSGDGDAPGFPSANWTDSITQLVRARIIQGFENGGFLKVGPDDGSVAADFKLALDIRQFRIQMSPQQVAEVAISAKIIDTDGKVAAAQIFSASVPDPDFEDAATSAAALDEAFQSVAKDLIKWATGAVYDAASAAPAPAPDVAPDAAPDPTGQ